MCVCVCALFSTFVFPLSLPLYFTFTVSAYPRFACLAFALLRLPLLGALTDLCPCRPLVVSLPLSPLSRIYNVRVNCLRVAG